jgi:membrane associated rhomboid family serine protease
LIQIISGAVSLPGVSSLGGVAFFAHIAGFLFGIIVGKIYKASHQPEAKFLGYDV